MTANGEDGSFVEDLNEVSIKIRNYMCFSDIAQGFESIKPINIIIGRNNSGKSRLMDMLQLAVSPKDLAKHNLNGKDTEILLSFPLVESELKRVFPENTSGGEIGGNFWEFGKKYIGHKITISITKNSNKEFVSLDPPFERQGLGKFEAELTRYARNPFSDKIIKKMTAERDIEPNAPNDKKDFHPNGSGATNIIELFLNDSKYPRDLVDNNLLADLNKIVSPDVFFESITVRRVENGNWEIFLKEKDKGLIPLSDSGSGLKTILLVLINIILIPKKEGNSLSRYIFVFEELENNLHPAIQRKLLTYIRDISIHNRATFFITTHSNVVIDLFSKDKNAQICHVVQNASVAEAKPVTTYIETSGILDDLDIRASDLLQSNGLIWVEGPSDRIYINKFIESWSEGALAEGLNYQCVFYGGRVLAHLSAETDVDLQKNLLNILLTNRNIILLMDSDKESEDDEINATKDRVREEIKDAGGLCWVTAGRTIENYIPPEAIKSIYNIEFTRQLNKYEDYREYLKESLPPNNKKYYNNKVLFAEKIRPHLYKHDLEKIYDLSTQMPKIIDEIKKWNKLE